MTSFFATIAQRVSRKVRGLVRRFIVPRLEHDEAVAALRVAYSLIVRHHDCGKRIELGGFCPHCHRPDGTEPEMDQIARAIHTANSSICVKGGGSMNA